MAPKTRGGKPSLFDLAQQRRVDSGAISNKGASISKEHQVKIDEAAAKKRADREAKKCDQDLRRLEALRDQDLRRLEALSKARNKHPSGRKGPVPVKDLSKDPCSRPRINRAEGSALVKSKVQSTQNELKSTEMLQKSAQQQSRPENQTTEQMLRKSEEPHAVGTTQHVDSKEHEESKQLCESAPHGKVSNIVEDSDDDSTAASGVAEDAPDNEEHKSEIVTKLQSLLEVRKGMLQNNLKVHEVDQTIKALEVELMALFGSR